MNKGSNNKGKKTFKNNVNNKAKRSYQNKESKSSKETESVNNDTNKYKLGSLNDVAWYTKYPELTYATASVPYPYRPGMLVPTFNTDWDEAASHTAIPGVLAITWIPSFGYSSKATDPASVVAREMYSRIRQSFSSTLSVGAPDIVMYIGALDSIYAYIAALKRIYRTVSSFSPDNYLLPNGLLKAFGFRNSEITQLLSNRTRLFSVINELIYMSRKFTCPQGMDMLNRHYWMGDNVYTDAPTINSQMYVFMPMRLYKFKLFADSAGIYSSGLEQVVIPWMTAVTEGDSDIVGTMFSFGRSLLDTLSAWEDAYTINGYLSRAYDGVPNFVVETLGVDESLTPVYVPEVLTQIENSRAIVGSVQSTNCDVTQDVQKNAVLCDPTYQVSDTGWYPIYGKMDPTINLAGISPTVAETLIATRLKWSLRSANPSGTGLVDMHVYTGTELVISYRLIINEEMSETYTAYINPEMVYVNGGTSTFSQLDKTLYLMQFEHHPQTWMVFANLTTDSIVRVFPLFNVTNLTRIDNDVLGNIHRVCIYSELNAFNM